MSKNANMDGMLFVLREPNKQCIDHAANLAFIRTRQAEVGRDPEQERLWDEIVAGRVPAEVVARVMKGTAMRFTKRETAMSLDKYVAQKVAASLAEFETKMHIKLPYSTTLQLQCRVLVLEAMRDQRQACAEALMATDVGILTDCKNRLHQAVMNAEPVELKEWPRSDDDEEHRLAPFKEWTDGDCD